MAINWGGMVNLLLLPAVVGAISLCHIYPSSYFCLWMLNLGYRTGRKMP